MASKNETDIEYPLSVGPRMKKLVNDFEHQKILAKKKAKEKTLFEKQLDNVEWDQKEKKIWNPEKMYEQLQVPDDMKLAREEFITYAENTWPYGRRCLLKLI